MYAIRSYYAQTGNYVATVTNNQGCSVSSSTYVQVTAAPSSCCSGFAYYSLDNHTGNWEDASTWGNASTGSTPNPPPTTPMNTQTLCLNGYVTVNGDLQINGGNQKLCDTLVITGNLTVQSYSLAIESTGVLIVLGNFVGASGSTQNNGRNNFV